MSMLLPQAWNILSAAKMSIMYVCSAPSTIRLLPSNPSSFAPHDRLGGFSLTHDTGSEGSKDFPGRILCHLIWCHTETCESFCLLDAVFSEDRTAALPQFKKPERLFSEGVESLSVCTHNPVCWLAQSALAGFTGADAASWKRKGRRARTLIAEKCMNECWKIGKWI